jgi:hypothetical protein
MHLRFYDSDLPVRDICRVSVDILSLDGGLPSAVHPFQTTSGLGLLSTADIRHIVCYGCRIIGKALPASADD